MLTKAYYCSYCLKSIKKSGNLNTHIKKSHYNVSNINISAIHLRYDSHGTLYCPKCSFYTISMDTLKSHNKSHFHDTKNTSKNVFEYTEHVGYKKLDTINYQLKNGKKNEEVPKVNQSEIKYATDFNYVLELINSYITITDHSLYTANELKMGLFQMFHINSLNFITPELLKELAKILYEEENKMYYVCGHGNSLQFCKAKNFEEWHKMQAFSGIFIPNIKVNNTFIAFDQFRLYVYDAISKSICPEYNKHQVENVTIYTKNKYGADVSFTAFHCINCNKYYTSTQAVQVNFAILNYPLFKISYWNNSMHEMHAMSELKFYGYSVKANEMSEYERQNLLAGLINHNIISKEKVIGILQHHINFNGKAENMQNSVAAWRADLSFVNDLNKNSQKNIYSKKTDIIYKGKKQ